MSKHIYFDLDGVLADFDKGVQELCIKNGIERGSGRDFDEKMWEMIKQSPRFYAKLDPMPGALQMFWAIHERYGKGCQILTGIPKAKRGIITSAEDKIAWVKKVLSPDIVVNTVYKEDKYLFCEGSDSILIDDLQQNIDDWNKSGGTGIRHITPEDTLNQLREQNIL